MEKDELSILHALRDTLKHRDELSLSLIDDNISIQIHHGRFHKAVIEQRKALEAAIESLRYCPFSSSPHGIEIIRTLVLISNAIKHLTGEDESVKKEEKHFLVK